MKITINLPEIKSQEIEIVINIGAQIESEPEIIDDEPEVEVEEVEPPSSMSATY